MPNGNTLTQQALKQRIAPLIRPYWASNIRTYAGFADQFYYAPDINEVYSILGLFSTPSPMGELYDCDDFAYEMKAHFSRYVRLSNQYTNPIAMGIAWARFSWINNGQLDHACNWFFDSTNTFYWIEPQNKQLYNLNQCNGYLNLLLV